MHGVSMQDESDAIDEEGGERVPSLVERGLFDSALAFYGAASAAIDQRERPTIRLDLDALQAVRAAMGVLEQRIEFASRAGLSPERIVSITRLEPELVERIVGGRRGR